ncbi:hypothetical protein FB391_3865 [Microbacterium kyungheense]|uniref:Glyoxalase/fosfomycin resistance/dioxygenase domain-containing protein n=1 Tax=Microbacterium kyungheense TaxID=1263636 RepID=A0A543EA91_9MICO|nr:hypothetical protein FB391_3865 [Microbacterium kyungheense]
MAFYRDTLGLEVTVWEEMGGGFTFKLPGGGSVFVYPKEDHEPAVFTILNFGVDDIDAAVDDLNARGVVTKIYTDPDYGTDEKGISRGFMGGSRHGVVPRPGGQRHLGRRDDAPDDGAVTGGTPLPSSGG